MKQKLSFKNSMKASMYAIIASVIVNSALFLIYKEIGIITDQIIVQDSKPMSIFNVLISSIIPLLIAGVLFFFIEKYTNNGFKIFSTLSVILLILSFFNPYLAIKDVSHAYATALNSMHIVVCLFLLFFLRKETKVV